VDDTGLIAAANPVFDRLLGGASGVLIAVSGGPDSMALLALLAEWARGRGIAPKLHAATVDHGLRPDAAAEAALCSRFAKERGIPHATLRWEGRKPASGLQEAAREARYALLADHARAIGATHLATAHHADDQAETVLMRLCAGSGIAGLAGMRDAVERDGLTHVRPLLGIPKAALQTFCAARGIAVAEDSSNSDPRFSRTRLRRILPLLAAEGLTVERLTRLASRAARADAALEAATASALARAGFRRADRGIRLDWREMAATPEDIRLRALGDALRASPAVGRVKLDGLERLLVGIDAANAAKQGIRRTLAGQVVTLSTAGVLTVATAPPRRG
jgi:tRNA(Ile)-lysidine synthase